MHNSVNGDPENVLQARDGSADDPRGGGGLFFTDVRLRNAYGADYPLVVETGDGLGTRVSVRFPKL